MILEQHRKITASYGGVDAFLSPLGALGIIEDAITELAGNLAIDGITAQQKYGTLVVITKNHLQFLKPLAWNEEVVVLSYVSGKSVARYWVDVCIKNAQQEVAVYARAEICGIDLQTQRIRRITTFGVDEHVVVEPTLYNLPSLNVQPETPWTFVEKVRVRTSNIDYAQHTNNVEYLRFILDTFTVAELLAHPVRELELSYLQQSFEGDVLSIYRQQTSAPTIYEVRKDAQAIFRCVLC